MWIINFDDLQNSFKFIHPKAQNQCKCFLLLAVTSYPTQQTWKFSHVRNQSFLSQVLRVTGPLGENFNFFSSFGLTFEGTLITKHKNLRRLRSDLLNPNFGSQKSGLL